MEPKAPETDNESQLSPTPRFRILKHRGWKASFRLEEAFWDVLSEASRTKGMKIADYIKTTLEQFDGNARNQSSGLRVHALEFLRERCREMERAGGAQNMINAALASPSPCFVLNAARQLINHNREFYDFVASLAAGGSSPGSVSSAQLTLDVAVPKLIDVLSSKPGTALTCGYAIKIDARLVRGKAKLILAADRGATMLIGYILDANQRVRPASVAS
ncbi:MAG TPA: ribbon-helix-helix domain-containing protein [Methylovirgula sp.]|nr:ribbon-helix-helix domain-containing protein [Methylovirgula sp.]